MFKAHISVLAVVTFVTTAQTDTPCCTPSQFSGVGRILTGAINKPTDHSTEVNFELQFDSLNRLVGTENAVQEGDHVSNYKLILDYRKGVQYLIKGRECVKSTLQQKDKIGCVPANSTLMSHYWFGSMEKYGEHMFAKSYQITDQGLMGFLSVTEKDCALVSETVYGSVNAVPMMRSTVLVNQTNYVDPTFFNVPESCIFKPSLPLVAPWSKLSFMNW
ncbi:uncharacterized protein LOC124279063 [Haliotis rubra]|uniref:uncharacterized protein LOC124279063 n=1 Tax=Haliotis rubra TaxID=36100 RepID=UPI001EE599EC|nr:uncharacterized protein LOC124279063 [Haliotis rubra]